MSRIYYVMGKSASGKDTIYKELLKRCPDLKRLVPWTTRPMRTGETEGHITVLTGLFAAAQRLTRAGASVDARVVPDAQHSEAYWEQRIPVFMEYLLK